jgi:hypothetical protein
MLAIPMKRVCPLLTSALLALGLAACGGAVSTSGFKGEAHAVAQRISDLQSDVTAANEQKVCEEDFSSAARARLSIGTEAGRHSPSAHIPGSASTCKQALKRQLGSIDSYELTVKQIAVRGATATAIVQSTWSGKLRLATLELVREGRNWRISGLG